MGAKILEQQAQGFGPSKQENWGKARVVKPVLGNPILEQGWGKRIFPTGVQAPEKA
jgi:hypothetical protein